MTDKLMRFDKQTMSAVSVECRCGKGVLPATPLALQHAREAGRKLELERVERAKR